MAIVASLRPLINLKEERLVLNFLLILDLIPGHSLNHKLLSYISMDKILSVLTTSDLE